MDLLSLFSVSLLGASVVESLELEASDNVSHEGDRPLSSHAPGIITASGSISLRSAAEGRPQAMHSKSEPDSCGSGWNECCGRAKTDDVSFGLGAI